MLGYFLPSRVPVASRPPLESNGSYLWSNEWWNPQFSEWLTWAITEWGRLFAPERSTGNWKGSCNRASTKRLLFLSISAELSVQMRILRLVICPIANVCSANSADPYRTHFQAFDRMKEIQSSTMHCNLIWGSYARNTETASLGKTF